MSPIGNDGTLETFFSWRDNKLPNSFEAILHDVSRGHPIIIVDDFNRENEGDLMIAASVATVENIAFMARHGRGIMCLPSAGWLLDRFEIPMMVPPKNATDPYQTAFTVSVDAKYGISTGVSAKDRVKTIQTMLDAHATPQDLARPGHLFPLRARDGLLKDRQGHTEASITLCKMVGVQPLAVISEIMNDDGSMSRLPELQVLARTHLLKIVSIPEIIGVLNP